MQQKYLVVLFWFRLLENVNYRNRLPPALGGRISFLTKRLLGDYVGFDLSSDTEVPILLKEFSLYLFLFLFTIPPMISNRVDVCLLFVLLGLSGHGSVFNICSLSLLVPQ